MPAALVFATVLAAPPTTGGGVRCEELRGLPQDRSQLRVRVVDDTEAHKPVPGATVFVEGAGGKGLDLTTDQSGVASVGGLYPGTYALLAYDADHDVERTVTLRGGRECTIQLELAAVGGITAEEAIEGPVNPHMTPEQREAYDRWGKIQVGGIGVIAVGVTLAAGSAFTALVGPCGGDGAEGTDCTTDTRKNLAIGFGVSGGAVLAGGIAMIVVGRKKKKEIERRAGVVWTPGLGLRF